MVFFSSAIILNFMYLFVLFMLFRIVSSVVFFVPKIIKM